MRDVVRQFVRPRKVLCQIGSSVRLRPRLADADIANERPRDGRLKCCWTPATLGSPHRALSHNLPIARLVVGRLSTGGVYA